MFSENTPQYVLIVSSTEKGAELISTLLDLKLGGFLYSGQKRRGGPGDCWFPEIMG